MWGEPLADIGIAIDCVAEELGRAINERLAASDAGDVPHARECMERIHALRAERDAIYDGDEEAMRRVIRRARERHEAEAAGGGE
jgi:hypothetical protein